MTLMRTNVEENRRIGAMIAETANRCAGPAVVLLPLRGVSMLDSPGGPFWDPDADSACYDAIRSGLNAGHTRSSKSTPISTTRSLPIAPHRCSSN